MNDLELKERVLKNPITTILGLVIAVGTVWISGGDLRANLFAAVVAFAGALMKHPGGGSGDGDPPPVRPGVYQPATSSLDRNNPPGSRPPSPSDGGAE